uniref:Uncharacterized protein n=1 Tax=Cacopsylla melanoneura TaxID=428564 RepID=A0A8D8QKN6_9HEMI
MKPSIIFLKNKCPSVFVLWSFTVLIASILFATFFYSGNLHSFINRKDEPVVSPGSFNRFGCSFASPGYDLVRNPNPSSWEGKLAPCVWGNEVEPLVLSNVEELTDLIEQLEQLHRQVSDTLLYNSIDNYIRFYADYNSSGLDFLTFYARYRPRFEPRENCIGLAIEVLDRIYSHLTPRWPNLPSHTYLASCRINVTAEWGPEWYLEWEAKWGEEENHVESQLIGGDVKHVLAVVKIEVQGRSGYILLDQGYPWASPGVLMLDEQYPQNDVIDVHDDNELNRLTLLLNNSYVHWEVITSDQTRVRESHLIYVRQPYCSFLDNTEKRDLVRPLHSIVRRNRLGGLVGGVVLGKNMLYKNTSKPAVGVLLLNDDRDERVRHLVPLKSLSQAGIAQNLPSHKDLSVLASATYLLNMKPGELLDKLQQVESILDDEAFIQGCKEVDEELDKEIIRREKQNEEEEDEEEEF